MRGAVWTVANELGVVASTPADLLAALLSGGPRTVRLGRAGHDPAVVAELAAFLGGFGHVRVVLEPPADEPEGPLPEPSAADGVERADLGVPLEVCAADPLRVTAAYEEDGGDHGGLRRAWLRAGQSLIREQEPGSRALVLLAALPDDADPKVRRALAGLAGGEPWRLEWTRPVQVAALTVCAGGLVVADPSGGVRTAEEPVGAATTASRVRAMAAFDDRTLLLLDERGRLHRHGGTASTLTQAVAATLESHPGTALAAAAGTVLVGDRMGSVHAFGTGGVHQAAPHSGRVTALTATGTPSPVVHSGGADGTVHAWTPGTGERLSPVAERPCPVVALHSATAADGSYLAVAWADGLVELRRPRGRTVVTFRLGPAVRAVAVTGDGLLCVGTDTSLICLQPA